MRCLQQNKAAHPSLSGAGPCTVCIMLQRINHSYPVSNCIYHQRPGCSGILAQEDDQTRRSKQYPVQAVGGRERILRRRWATFRWIILLGREDLCLVLFAFKPIQNRANYSIIYPFRPSWRNVWFDSLAEGKLHLSPNKETINGHLEATKCFKCVGPNTKRKRGKQRGSADWVVLRLTEYRL